MRFLIVYLWAVIFLLFSCKNESKPQEKQAHNISKQELKKELLKSNNHFLKIEDQNIKDYIQRHHYQMTKTGTGLYYEIYKEGSGPVAQEGDIAVLKYTLRLINGVVVYDSEQDGLKEFRISKGGVESGLEEGILLLKLGDCARFILPSHLAFGLAGDHNKIPRKATLVYDIELINLK